MGINLDLEQMLGLPSRVRCPACKEWPTQDFTDEDIDREGVNQEPGVWRLICHCGECGYAWYQTFQLQCLFVGTEPISS